MIIEVSDSQVWVLNEHLSQPGICCVLIVGPIIVISDVHCHFLSHQYCIWTDGLNALLGKDMLSDLTRNDLDTLLSMEIKLRLLDLENIQIPDAPPPIPKEPSNYDFVYDCNWSGWARTHSSQTGRSSYQQRGAQTHPHVGTILWWWEAAGQPFLWPHF